MRLAELSLERYCGVERRVLSLSPGLNVVHGPNEAGKSTSLSAIQDLLFGISPKSARVARFGSDAARIGMRVTTSDGGEVSLLRRCGRGRTLMDGACAPCDEAVLASLLGAVDRDRFETLFALDQDGLRKGGEALLAAKGDVGRLIVDAGGGLRALVGRLDGLDDRIDALFAPRRKAGRAFYDALARFDAADRAARATLLTHDAYERDRRAAEASAAETGRLRAERRTLVERASRLGRLGRVVPLLRELDRLGREVAAFDDVAHLPDAMPDECSRLLERRAAAAERLGASRRRLDDVRGRRDAVDVDATLAALGAEVRELEVGLAVVAASRRERAARVAEAEAADARLELLREELGLAPEADLLARLPPRSAARDVRILAERHAGLATRLGSARRELAEAERAVAVSRDRLADMVRRGHDRPFGFAATGLATLPSAWAIATARLEAAEALEADARDRAVEIGLVDVTAARRLPCPDEGQVRAEIRVRDEVRVELARAASARARAVEDREDARMEAAASLEAGGIATEETVHAARRTRDEAWASVDAAFVDGDRALPTERRRAMARCVGAAIVDADRLADRRGAEAERGAALAQAGRRIAAAEGTIAAASEAMARLDHELVRMDEAIRTAFPEACALRSDVAALLPFSAALAKVVEASDRALAERRVGEAMSRELAPAMAKLEDVERMAALSPPVDARLRDRVEAVVSAVAERDRAHDSYSREREASLGHEGRLRAAASDLREVEARIGEWAGAWRDATAALGASDDGPVPSIAEQARLWEQARGDLRASSQARGVVARMDRDEAALAALAATVAGRLGAPTPSDPFAGGEALIGLWQANEAARLVRDALGPEVCGAEADMASRHAEWEAVEGRVAALARESGLPADVDRLRLAAVRRASLLRLARELDATDGAVRGAGEGLPLATLREEARGCELDAVRAEASEVAARLDALDGRIEASIAEEVRAEVALRAHLAPSDAGVAAAAREAAVADVHDAVERYVELKVARGILDEAVRVVRDERQEPLVGAAGKLFARMTGGAYSGVAADVDDRGTPVVRGVRSAGGSTEPTATMSAGTRDQMYLAFRLASVAAYCAVAEPLPFVGDDLVVNFDDARAEATLDLLADFAETTQVLLFTHHRAVRDVAARLARDGRANVVEFVA